MMYFEHRRGLHTLFFLKKGLSTGGAIHNKIMDGWKQSNTKKTKKNEWVI